MNPTTHSPLHRAQDVSLAAYTRLRAALVVARNRITSDDRGEGVISAAIVVLIMAFLGALMWGAFKLMFEDAASNTSSQVGSIGS